MGSLREESEKKPEGRLVLEPIDMSVEEGEEIYNDIYNSHTPKAVKVG